MSDSKNFEAHSTEHQDALDEKNAAATHDGETRHDSRLDRIGKKTALLLVGCIIVEIAAIAFLAFLWYGTIKNKSWHAIVAHNWVTRSVTLASLALRIAMGIQGATALSMLAALTLERLSVPIKNLAEISLMRSGNKTDLLSVVLNFLFPLYPLVRNGPKADRRYAAFALGSTILVLVTLIVSQFSSTFLLSDVKAQGIPGKNFTSSLKYDYEFTNSPANKASIYGSGWWKGGSDKKHTYGYTYPNMAATSYWISRTPLSWPTFAEYSEPPYVAKNVHDTGVSLRAFLPYVNSQDRSNIESYNGKALVFDARVTCQKPQASNLIFDGGIGVVVGTHDFQDGHYGTLTGTVSPTVKTPNMIQDVGSKYDFSCSVAADSDTGKKPWSICQLATWQDMYDPAYPTLRSQPLFGLKSMLQAGGSKNQTGAAFLLVSSSPAAGTDNAPDATANDDTFLHVKEVASSSTLSDLIFGFSMSLCFASYDVADRDISAFSHLNRTEPSPSWDVENSVLDLSDVIHQLDTGYSRSGTTNSNIPTPEERGILRLSPREDWSDSQPNQDIIDGPDQLQYVPNLSYQQPKGNGNNVGKGWDVNFVPFVLNSMAIYGGAPRLSTSLESGAGNNSWTAMMYPGLPGANAQGTSYDFDARTVTSPDWVVNTFNPLLEKSRPAVALQAVLTSMAGVGYYDRVTQYTKSAPVAQVFFETHDSAGGPNGTRRTKFPGGFVAVLVILLVHLILTTMIMIRFLILSHLTRIGDGWQAIAQIALSEQSRPVLERSAVGGGKSAVDEIVDPESGRPLKQEHVGLRSRGGLARMFSM